MAGEVCYRSDFHVGENVAETSAHRRRPGALRPARRPCPVCRSRRQGRLSQLVQPGGAGEAPARHRHAAFVLLLGDAAGVRGGGRGGPVLRDRGVGYASILMSNPLQGIGASPKAAQQAQAAIDKGRQMGAKTERERDYLEAVAAYYEDFANRTERARQLARAKAYEELAAKYPGDDEAQIFYALYLAGTQLASDQTYSAWLKAAGILEKQFAKHPAHPGVAHYLIP